MGIGNLYLSVFFLSTHSNLIVFYLIEYVLLMDFVVLVNANATATAT